MPPSARLHYVDWLRVSAFLILIAYHSSVAFFPDMDLAPVKEMLTTALAVVGVFLREGEK